MIERKFVFILVILVSLVFAVSAIADPGRPSAAEQDVSTTPMARLMLKLAVNYWHGAVPYCPAGYRIVVTNLETQDAWGLAEVPGCRQWLSEAIWTESSSPTQKLVALCTTVIHEYGHSLGLEHNHDALSVMNPETIWGKGMPSACQEIRSAAKEIGNDQVELEARCETTKLEEHPDWTYATCTLAEAERRAKLGRHTNKAKRTVDRFLFHVPRIINFH